MKDSLKNKLSIILLAILFIASLSHAFYKYFEGDSAIVYYSYVSDILLVASLIIYYRLIQRLIDFEHKTIQENLKIFIKLLASLYLVIIFLKLILDPAWSDATTPKSPDTISTVIFASIATSLAIGFFVPMLMIINKLIFYKRKKSTTILVPLLYTFTLAGMFTSIFTRIPLDISPEGDGIYNTLALIGALCIIFILALAHFSQYY